VIGRSAVVRSLASVGLALVLAGGCRPSPPPPHVESVRVADTTLETAVEVGLDRAAVEAVSRAALVEAGFLLTPGPPAYRARIELVGLRLGQAAGGRGLQVEARVELELTAVEGQEPARREVGSGSEALGQQGAPGATRAALAAAVGEAARGLRVGLSAEGKPVEALLADLESSDVRLRDHAVQALGERREPRAVPGLIKRLSDGDRRVVDRAIGALSQLKDRRAVPALIELSRGTDAAIALRLVPVVGDIGGGDAEGWLLTIEQAHPDPRVRAAATDALADLHGSAAGRK
jgi:hypothetical protein